MREFNRWLAFVWGWLQAIAFLIQVACEVYAPDPAPPPYEPDPMQDTPEEGLWPYVALPPNVAQFVSDYHLLITFATGFHDAQDSVLITALDVIDIEDYGQHLKCLAWCLYAGAGIGVCQFRDPSKVVRYHAVGATLETSIRFFKP